jgi:hypothetical protein
MRLRIKSPRGWFQQLLFFTCRSMVDDVKATSETYAKRGLGYLTWGKGDDCPWPLIFHTPAATPSRRYHKWDDLKLAPYNLEGIGNPILKFKVIHPMLKMSCDKGLGTDANNFGRLPPARACCGVSMRGARVFTPPSMWMLWLCFWSLLSATETLWLPFFLALGKSQVLLPILGRARWSIFDALT